jgi:hypothetical protein
VQAKAYGYDEIEITIIEQHLPKLEKHNYQAIAREMKIPIEDVYEAAREIQKLESRPARNFTDEDDRTIGITPDVYVLRDGADFVVMDNDRGVQRLFINEALTKQLMQDPSAKEFVGEKLRNAQWLIRAIEQRRKTIIRVAECIVEKQREFFEHGVAHLKPLILRDVAEAVGMHESTISRVTTNKYMHTPQGLFELKYFFNSSIRRVANEDIASESVKQAIKTLIEAEDKANPLSDQAIVEHLAGRRASRSPGGPLQISGNAGHPRVVPAQARVLSAGPWRLDRARARARPAAGPGGRRGSSPGPEQRPSPNSADLRYCRGSPAGGLRRPGPLPPRFAPGRRAPLRRGRARRVARRFNEHQHHLSPHGFQLRCQSLRGRKGIQAPEVPAATHDGEGHALDRQAPARGRGAHLERGTALRGARGERGHVRLVD